MSVECCAKNSTKVALQRKCCYINWHVWLTERIVLGFMYEIHKYNGDKQNGRIKMGRNERNNGPKSLKL